MFRRDSRTAAALRTAVKPYALYDCYGRRENRRNRRGSRTAMTLTSRTVVRNAWGIVGVATVERPWLDSHPWRILPPRSFDLSFSLLTVPECTSRVSSSPPEAEQVCSTYKYGLYSMFGFSFSVEKKWIRIVEMSSMLIFNSFYLEWNLFFLLLLLLFFFFERTLIFDRSNLKVRTRGWK